MGMQGFRFKAVTTDGRLVEGIERAASRSAALEAIEARALVPVVLDSCQKELTSRRAAGRVAPRAITDMTEQLALLLRAGVPLDRALALLSDGASGGLRRLFASLAEGVASGMALSEALSAHPAQFGPTYLGVIRAAERSGAMEASIDMLVRERRRVERLKDRMAASLAYPAFLAVAATGVLAFVLLFVIPQFKTALADLEIAAAGQASAVFALSDFAVANRQEGLVVIATLLGAGLLAFRSSAVADAFFDAASLMPGLGRILEYERTAGFSALLGLLLSSGSDLPSALRHSGEILRQPRHRRELEAVVRSVRGGRRLSQALDDSSLIAPAAGQMLRVAEEGGELAEACERVSLVYQSMLDKALNRLTAVAAPVLLLLVSALIAWMIVAVVGALLSVNEMVL